MLLYIRYTIYQHANTVNQLTRTCQLLKQYYQKKRDCMYWPEILIRFRSIISAVHHCPVRIINKNRPRLYTRIRAKKLILHFLCYIIHVYVPRTTHNLSLSFQSGFPSSISIIYGPFNVIFFLMVIKLCLF